jgi:flagellar hook-associated protein 2
MSTTNRVLGIVSGFDTETLVSDLMNVENLKLENLEKEKQYVAWEQEAYQDIVSMLSDFKSNYFDNLNLDTNLTSKTAFNEFDISIKQNGEVSSAVEIFTNDINVSDTHVIDSITQLASKDTWTGNLSGIRGISSESFDFAYFQSRIDTSDLSFSLSIEDVEKTITVSNADIAAMSDIDDLVSTLNTAIADAFGSDYSSVVTNLNNELYFNMAGNDITVLQGDSSTSLGAMRITSGSSTEDYKAQSLNTIFGVVDADVENIVINDVSITLDSSGTLDDMISAINSSEAGVKISYNTLEDKFVLKSNKEGSMNNIVIEDGSATEDFFAKLFNVNDVVDADGAAVDVTRDVGENAIVSLDGTSMVQSSNTFSYEGLVYTLKETSATAIDIDLDVDSDAIMEKIKGFVEDYNEILETINSKLSEKRYYDYEPLTAEEKEAMTEDDIAIWESRAKSGILKGSSELSSMLTSFRNAVIDKVSDSSLTFNDIGISSSSYLDKGKLTINESTLKDAIENNYTQVVKLFTKESDYDYGEKGFSGKRYSDNGVASRFEDILKDYIRTTRDDGGYKGTLIEKVGIENDSSYFDNFFYDKVNDYNDEIDAMMEYLADKEDYYYTMFANMESALSEMESSYSSLLSSMGN